MNAYRAWLAKHLTDATAEFKKLQALDDRTGNDRELYERVHQMWGYLAGLEKCLKEFDVSSETPAAAKKKPAPKKTRR